MIRKLWCHFFGHDWRWVFYKGRRCHRCGLEESAVRRALDQMTRDAQDLPGGYR